jgi:hypothetical protein
VLRHCPLIPFAVHSCAEAAPNASDAAAAMRPTRITGLTDGMTAALCIYPVSTPPGSPKRLTSAPGNSCVQRAYPEAGLMHKHMNRPGFVPHYGALWQIEPDSSEYAVCTLHRKGWQCPLAPHRAPCLYFAILHVLCSPAVRMGLRRLRIHGVPVGAHIEACCLDAVPRVVCMHADAMQLTSVEHNCIRQHWGNATCSLHCTVAH